MRDSQDWEGSFRRFAVIAVAFILAVAILIWGPWNTTHNHRGGALTAPLSATGLTGGQ